MHNRYGESLDGRLARSKYLAVSRGWTRCRLPNRQEDKVVSSVDLLFSIKMVKSSYSDIFCRNHSYSTLVL